MTPWQKKDIFDRISRSKFRSSFHLKKKDKQYIEEKGMDTIYQHAYDLLSKRIGPAIIENDGKQTPMKGHPVFIGQHACALCCRGCMEKWHGIPKGRELSEEELQYFSNMILKWIDMEMKKPE